jgi:ArsR family metal-binding transcriptional regulator
MAELYVESIALTRTLPCLAEPGKIIVVGKPSRALDDVLPYLATLPNVIAYNPLAQAINATWERRHELAAITERKRAPRHLDIWELLPRTNCGRCGEATCLAFAVKLILRKRTLEECPPLQDDASFADRRATLETML